MNSFTTRIFHGMAFAAALACSQPAALAQAPALPSALPPIGSFFANAPFGDAELSPDARHLAVRSSAPGQRDFLVVIDLQANRGKIVASYANADVGDFVWVNNGRLLFNTREKGVAPGDATHAPGLYAVDHDGVQAGRRHPRARPVRRRP
jgi:hypothetical protein